MSLDVFEVRRGNLKRFIADKFEGNASAMARAAGKHQNQINLTITDNENIRRNMGERIAREIEEALALPAGYFDVEQPLNDRDVVVSVFASEIGGPLQSILRTDDELHAMGFYKSALAALDGKITDQANLVLCRVATRELDPEIAFGSHVIADVGVKAVSSDGVYVLTNSSGLFLRRVSKRITGGWSITSPNPQAASSTVESLKGIKATARLVMMVRTEIL